jgi:DNA-binding transcriptional MerR regulator
VARLRIIRNALSMGFSLKELGAILKIRDQGGAPCHQVRRLAEEKVEALTQQIDDLILYRSQLRGVLADWDARLRETGRSGRARLLEALASAPKRPAGHLSLNRDREEADTSLR